MDELDLQLMNDCMGAIADPNIVRIDTNYDSRVNLPDFGLFAVDYGYSFDPNESDNNDPNCERSDFDFDHRVDLADLEVLAQNWLTLVFDEYRICGLCNIGTNTDPNEPDTTNVIDSKDYDALMADWDKQGTVDPNISIAQSASQLSIAIGNTDLAWKISAFFDDEPIGQWVAGELGSSAFDVDLTHYGPGSHRVKIVRNIGYGLAITERVITDPNSTGLYFADVPETFEPNEPYNIRGFNLNDSELNFKIGNVQGETVYDVNVPTGPVNLSVSASVFGESMMTTLAVAKTPIVPGDEDRYEEFLTRKFDPNDYKGQWVRVVILLPDKKATYVYERAIFAALTAVEKRGLSYVVLSGYDVNQDNLNFLFQTMYGRKIVIFFGHANSHVGAEWIGGPNGHNVGGVQRTQFQCYAKSKRLSPGNYYNLGAVSYTVYSKDGAELLPKFPERIGSEELELDRYAYDMKRVLRDSCKIDKMLIFGCLSGAYDDMAQTQFADGLHEAGHQDMLYVGLTIKVLQVKWGLLKVAGGDDLIDGLEMFFNEWGKPGNNGKGKTILNVLNYLDMKLDKNQKTWFFGPNGIHDTGDMADDVVKFFGLGYQDITLD